MTELMTVAWMELKAENRKLKAERDEAIDIIERYHRQACNTHELAEAWLAKVRERGAG